MKNTLWTFGCSFTAEWHPLNNTPPNNYDKYKIWRGGNLPKVWPTILSECMGFDLQNLGKGASSNDMIFKTFCHNVKDINEGDVVVIGWTSMLRALMANQNTHQLQDVLVSQDYPEFDRNFLDYYFINRSEDAWSQQIIAYIEIINELAKSKKFKVVYWSSDDKLFNYLENHFDGFIDSDFIVNRITKNYNLIRYLSYLNRFGFKTSIIDETLGAVKDCHSGEIGHKIQAKIIYNHLKKYGKIH